MSVIDLSFIEFLKSKAGTDDFAERISFAPVGSDSGGQALNDKFGSNISFNTLAGDKATGNGRGKRTETGRFGARYYAKDVLGREYYLPVSVTVGNDTKPGTSSTYAELLGVQDAAGKYTGVWDLPYPLITAWDMNAHVVDTELTERDGMVSELINLSGYRINIRGYIINQLANEEPEADYDTMVWLGNIKKPVRIDSVLTDVLFMESDNHTRLATIRNLNFTKKQGVKNVIEYNMHLVTEVPFSLIDIS